MPFILRKFLDDLTKTEKRRLDDLQEELYEKGFGKEHDIVQKQCRDEAIRLLRLELKGKGL